MSLDAEVRVWFDKFLAAIVAAEQGPSEFQLELAAVIDRWRPLMTPSGNVVLWGVVFGHPQIGSGYIITSQLIAIDFGKNWARTASRWYVLERPWAEIEAEIAVGKRLRPVEEEARLEASGLRPLDDEIRLMGILAANSQRIRDLITRDDEAVEREK